MVYVIIVIKAHSIDYSFLFLSHVWLLTITSQDQQNITFLFLILIFAYYIRESQMCIMFELESVYTKKLLLLGPYWSVYRKKFENPVF